MVREAEEFASEDEAQRKRIEALNGLQNFASTSGTRMQRIRSKPAVRDHAAKYNPVLYVNSEGKTARTAKLHNCSIG
ncbi:hypothetical protein FS749_015398 [Ceratobasidium sp. UAMH 11750]|nr:hypothetical protein FS749_015398 [Ceratobasidium sp. UAMH 11750]